MNAIASPALQVPDTIGAPFEGGFYGGQIRIGAALYAIAWAPKAQGEIVGTAWLDHYDSVPGATSCNDSAANTKAMAEAGSALAKWAQGLEIGGFTDWCVPARDVLELAYRHLKPTDDENATSFRDGDNPSSVPPGLPYTDTSPALTSVLAFRAGGPEAFDPQWYWSSTQYSSFHAWLQGFSNGFQISIGYKRFEARCRAVRMIQLGTSTLQSFNPASSASASTKPPAIGARWPGVEGVYAGVSRGEDGQPDAHLVLLDIEPEGELQWEAGVKWAKDLGDGAHLPTRFESALLYANLRDRMDVDSWHWTGTQYSSDFAWNQHFYYGYQSYYDKSFEARCRAVRRFVL